jgi:hypothetical protein
MTMRVVLVAVVVAFPVGEAVACKCDAPKTAVEALDRADLVFEGRAVARHATKVSLGFNGDGTLFYLPAWSYEFVVERQWKGEVRPRQFVATMFGGCGLWFEPGKLATIYASRQEDGQYATERCRAPAHNDTEALGRPLHEMTLADVARPIAPTSWPSDVPEIVYDGWRSFHAHAVRETILVGAGVVLALLPLLRRRRVERRRREGCGSSRALTP